jgi:hypothetical protein
MRFTGSKLDIAAKRHKKYKNKISGLVNSMNCNEQKSNFTFYESIKLGL